VRSPCQGRYGVNTSWAGHSTFSLLLHSLSATGMIEARFDAILLV
jgi:hypothetical protein